MSKKLKLKALVEKYKPRKLEDVVGRDDLIYKLQCYLDQGYIPNQLFAGTQGSGKTLIQDLLIAKYYEGDNPSGNVINLDASTNNKVEFIRSEILTFLKTRNMNPNKRKVLKLDEFDYVTKDGQATLRKPIEKAAKRTIFLAACNFINNIILPIQSRFELTTFEPLSIEAITIMMDRIITGESIKVVGNFKDIMKEIYKYSRGELRFTINNYLEPARALGKLTLDDVRKKHPVNVSYFETALACNIDGAIQIALQDPRGVLSGALNFITEAPVNKYPIPVKTKMIQWINDAYSEVAINIPFHVAITNLTYKLSNFVRIYQSKSRKK